MLNSLVFSFLRHFIITSLRSQNTICNLWYSDRPRLTWT